MADGDATMLFGLGATKAGTSWLWQYLRAHPECHIRTIKELHFFDTIEADRIPARVAELRRRRDALRAQDAAGDLKGPRKLTDMTAWVEVMDSADPQEYLAFLTHRLRDKKLVADITPAYATLPVPRLRQMAALSPRSRFVYLMRDPLSRLWSHVRMIARRTTEDEARLPDAAHALLGRVVAGQEPSIASRSDYAAVLSRLGEAVAPSRVFSAFFEDMLSGEGLIDRLCRFLGIAPHPAPVEERVHEGIRIPLDPDHARAALRWLEPQYTAVSARMGRLPSQWEANLARV